MNAADYAAEVVANITHWTSVNIAHLTKMPPNQYAHLTKMIEYV